MTVDSFVALRKFAAELEPRGAMTCVRATLAAARASRSVFERAEPTSDWVAVRIAAVERWLECPCDAHAREAAKLAFANGDDRWWKGWNPGVVDDAHASSAHWSADWACQAVDWANQDDAEKCAGSAAEACGYAAGALGGEAPWRAIADAVAAEISRDIGV